MQTVCPTPKILVLEHQSVYRLTQKGVRAHNEMVMKMGQTIVPTNVQAIPPRTKWVCAVVA